MKNQDHITGGQIRSIIEQLKNGKSFVRIKLSENGIEQLTMIYDIRSKGNRQFFIIDRPEGFSDDVDPANGKRVDFEFVGVDRLPYFFHTRILRVDPKEIWVAFPEGIARKQLRRNFRVDVPSGTSMSFHRNGVKIDNQVVNLSLGGSLCALIRYSYTDESETAISVGDFLTDIELVFRPKFSAPQRVKIGRAAVVRVDEKPETPEMLCALQFTQIEKSEEKILTEMIYIMQREYLKKRLQI